MIGFSLYLFAGTIDLASLTGRHALRPVQNCMFEMVWYAVTILFRTCIIS